MARQHYFIVVAGCIAIVVFGIIMTGNQSFSTRMGISDNLRGEIQTPKTAGLGDLQFYYFRVQSEADADLVADGDGVIDAGEDVTVDISIINYGATTYYSVSGNLTLVDPYVMVPGFSAQFGKITGSGGTSTGRFRFIVSGACPDKRNLPFNLSLTDNLANMGNVSITLVVNGTSAYTIGSTQLIAYSGDGDGNADAGETWYLKATIINTGTAIGKNVHVYFDSANCHVGFYYTSLVSRGFSISSMDVGSNITLTGSSTWRFTIKKTIPSGSWIQFYLKYNDTTTPILTEYSIPVNVIIGGTASGDGGTNCDAPATSDGAIEISVGTYYSTNSFSAFDDTDDYFKIYLYKEYTYTIQMVHASSCDFDITLYNSTRSVKSDSSTGATTTLTYKATSAGYYYIAIHATRHGSPDTYSLQVTESTNTNDYSNIIIAVVIAIISIITFVGIAAKKAKSAKTRASPMDWRGNLTESPKSIPKPAVIERPYPTPSRERVNETPAPTVMPKRPITLLSGNLEDLVHLQRTVNPIGSQLRLEISMENRSSEALNHLTLDLDIPNALRWDIESTPDVERTGSTLALSRLGTWERKKITIIITPLGPVDAFLGATLHFCDNGGQTHDIPLKPKLITFTK